MEKIRINAIEKKDSGLVIVKYLMPNDAPGCAPREATMNTKWQAQEVNVLENDAGIGGTIDVEIKEKMGNQGQVYTNITKIDFKSAKKGATGGHEDWMRGPTHYDEVHDGVRSVNGQEQKPYFNEKVLMGAMATDRDKSIIAQCLVKAVIGAWDGKGITIPEAVDMYKQAKELLG